MRRFGLAEIVLVVFNFIFSLAILLLLVRFFFRLLGANAATPFVRFIYNSTTPLLDPFRGIFAPVVIDEGNVLEFTTLFAIACYVFLAFLLSEFIAYVTYSSTTYRRTVVERG